MKAFAAFTTAHVGHAIELRIDGAVVLTAILRDPILSGKIEVSGEQPRAALEAIAGRLRSGAARIEVEAVGN